MSSQRHWKGERIITMKKEFLSQQLRLCTRFPPSDSLQGGLRSINWHEEHQGWVDPGTALPTVSTALTMMSYKMNIPMLGLNFCCRVLWNYKTMLDSKCKRFTVRRYTQIIALGTFSTVVWKGVRWTTAKVTGRAHGHFSTLCYVCLITALSQA